MRQLVCMSAYVYCQNLNNWRYTEMSYLYSNGKKGETGEVPERQRERECVRDRTQLKIELAFVVKMAVGE
jgi:hypothetical protein